MLSALVIAVLTIMAAKRSCKTVDKNGNLDTERITALIDFFLPINLF